MLQLTSQWATLGAKSDVYNCLVDAAQVITTQRELTRTDDENRALTDLALRGLQLLSSWNVRIMELVICIDTWCTTVVVVLYCRQL